MSSLVVIPIILIAKNLKNLEMGLISALLASIAWSYYNRTMIGYYDTDMLNIVLPMFLLWSIIWAINTKEDKYNIGVVQGFSELADQIADSKNIELTTTLPNETRLIIGILKAIVLTGAALVFWMFIFRPIYMRIKYGKEK